MRIGVDTGGTFTDCVFLAEGEMKVVKVFSGSPASPALATRPILEGIQQLVGAPADGALEILHGTTLSTNSLLERRGARVALVTTRGFEDLIEIGRQTRPELYNLTVRRAPPLVPRELRYGVAERTGAGGNILARPSTQELEKLRHWLRKSKAESVAVCLLFSFANPENERIVLRAIRSLGLPVSVSHRILPEFREYERLSTVTINAFLMPRVGAYLARLERQAGKELRPAPRRRKKDVRVFVMESSGGITTAAHAAREPVRTILSGPAGGVAAAAWLMQSVGIRRAISFDMGGTSTDVCLLDGRPPVTSETTLGELPVAVPVVDVRSVGAGGGSLVRLDAGGALRVGPESAGASPGPVCYGRGGRQLTVTDAHLVLGRLDPEHFLGGTFRLDAAATAERFREFLQERSAGAFRNPLQLARGILAVANSNMEAALRVISVERGHDPRDFALIAFGGAGGLHCADLGRALGVRTIIIPPNPGAFSALGVLLSDMVQDASRSVLLPVPEQQPRGAGSSGFAHFLHNLDARFRKLELDARAELRRDHFPAGKVGIERKLDVRYLGQAYELTVPFSARFPEDFRRLHERTYGYAHEQQPLEVINLRLRLTVATPKPELRQRLKTSPARDIRKALIRRRQFWLEGALSVAPLYDRELLPCGARFRGPAIVAEYSSTTVVPRDYFCSVDANGDLVLRQDAN